jgi:hypothetical protein
MDSQPDKTNVHYYDGKICKDTQEYLALKNICGIHPDEKALLIIKFGVSLGHFQISGNNPTNMNYFNTMLAGIGSTNNYDPTNEMSADDILYMCANEWFNIPKENRTCIAEEFFLAMADMSSGFCPQGRVDRIWQVAVAYFDWYMPV